MGRTQFTAISKHLPAINASVGLFAPVAPFMSVQGGLAGEDLSADGTFEIFIYCH